MINLKELKNFLVKAKKATYASGDERNKIKEKDNSTTLIFEQGDRKYHDNYFGGEPYGGREIVFYKNKPIYIMTYYGRVDISIPDAGNIYKFLQNALTLIPENNPYRGPEKYTNDNYIYTNTFSGEVDNFFGEEIIESDGKEIYKAKYIGGLVDQR